MWEIDFKTNTIKFYNKGKIVVELFGFIPDSNMAQVYLRNINSSQIITDRDIDVFLLKCWLKANDEGWNVGKEWNGGISTAKNSFINLQNRVRAMNRNSKNY